MNIYQYRKCIKHRDWRRNYTDKFLKHQNNISSVKNYVFIRIDILSFLLFIYNIRKHNMT